MDDRIDWMTGRLHGIAALTSVVLLCACGGGGSADSVVPSLTATTSTAEATSDAANATYVSSSAETAIDATVITAQSVVSIQAGSGPITITPAALNDPRAQVSAVTSVPVTCAGGGTATITISGGTVGSLVNGRFDAGEVYTIVFAACRNASAAASVSGTIGVNVLAASGNDFTLALTATDLAVALPIGVVTLNGNATVVETSTTSGASLARINHLTSASIDVTTQFNGRTDRFTLTSVDLTRVANYVSSVLQSSTFTGTHASTATVAGVTFSYAVSAQTGATYSATGVPTTGNWAITLPRALLTLTISGGVATIAVDEGNNGSVDRSFNVPIATLQANAG